MKTLFGTTMVVCLFALLASFVAGTARAELPEGEYDKLRIGAPEALVIEVSSVKTKEIQPR